MLKIDTTEKNLLDVLSSYFERDEKNIIRCKVKDCKSTISRWQLYYFKRHFNIVHQTLLKELFPNCSIDTDTQCKVEISELTYNAVELVTLNGCPFSILDTPAIRGFLKKQLDELAKNGYKFTLNRHLIVNKVKDVSEKIITKITAELKGKLFSIMFDVCTKRTFSVLGISATFMENDVVVARSLGTVQLVERHRGPYMAEVVDTTLQKYGASTDQIISATADQASNMDNTAKHLAIHAYNMSEGSGDILLDEEFEYAASESDEEVDMELENQIELQNELNNDDRYITLVSDMVGNIMRRNNLVSMVPKLHCCAHTSQLGINEAINSSNARNILDQVREMTKLLRTTVVNIKFQKIMPKCILPPMFVETRWNSEYIMVCIFLILFTFINT